MSNLTTCLAFTLKWEAGYQCDARDGGNWTGGHPGRGVLVGTNRGISAPTLAAYLRRPITADDMKGLDLATAPAIYGQDYAAPLLLEALASGPALMLFDASVQHGVSGTVLIAQSVVDAKCDGRMGPVTAAAIGTFTAAAFVPAFGAAFLAYLQGLDGWAVFGDGWGRRAAARLAEAAGFV